MGSPERSVLDLESNVNRHRLQKIGPVDVAAGLPALDFAGGYAELLLEGAAEIIGIRKSAGSGNLLDGIAAGAQPGIGFLQLFMKLVFMNGFSHNSGKARGKCPDIEPGDGRAFLQGEEAAGLIAEMRKQLNDPFFTPHLILPGGIGNVIEQKNEKQGETALAVIPVGPEQGNNIGEKIRDRIVQAHMHLRGNAENAARGIRMGLRGSEGQMAPVACEGLKVNEHIPGVHGAG